MSLVTFHHCFRRIDRTRGPPGPAIIARRIFHWSPAKMDHAATSIACRLWRGCRDCIGLQRTDRRRGICRRDRARLGGHGNFWPSGFFVSHRDVDSARISRTRSAVRNPAVPAQRQLGDWTLSFARPRRRSPRAMVHSAAAHN